MSKKAKIERIVSMIRNPEPDTKFFSNWDTEDLRTLVNIQDKYKQSGEVNKTDWATLETLNQKYNGRYTSFSER